MKQKNINRKRTEQRSWMIEFITNAIKQLDDEKLRNIYNFVLHIR